MLACNQIGRNLSVAISRYFYNKNTQEHAVLKEQNRISRELHDSLAQQLSAVANKLEFIERQIVSEESLNLILPEIKQLKDLVELTNNDVRESISGLRLLKPDDNYSFAEVIEKYLTVFKKTCPDIEIDIDIAQHNLIIPFNIQIQLFRIIQEGLTNIRKHSKATKVSVSLKFYNNSLGHRNCG